MIATASLISSAIQRNMLYNDLRDEKERLESALRERESLYKKLKNTQEQLLQSQKMEAMGRFAGGIAHDFNNILVSIQGYAELASSSPPPESERIRGYIEKVLKACERASNLTRQILAFSRKQEVDFQVIDLNRVLRDFTGIIRSLLPEDIRIRTEASSYLPPIEGDPYQIEQVIMNMVANAGDAMEDGGELTLKTGYVELTEERARPLGLEPGGYALLTITDTGQGMTEDVMRRIFEPFYTTKGKGTGLGLSVAYGIIRQHRGAIEVESQLGEGSSFRIYLPSTEKVAIPVEGEKTAEVVLGGKEDILIVEDDDGVRLLLKELLESLGYRVREARDGKDALKVVEGGKGFDLLVTDVVMPGMDGREVYENMRRLFPHIKVIFMSGYTDDIIHKHWIKEQGAHFIEKPFTLDRVAKKVREILDS